MTKKPRTRKIDPVAEALAKQQTEGPGHPGFKWVRFYWHLVDVKGMTQSEAGAHIMAMQKRGEPCPAEFHDAPKAANGEG